MRRLDTPPGRDYNLGMLAWASLRRVYVRLPNWLGDVVLATPFFHALRRAAPGARVIAHGKRPHLRILEHEGLYDLGVPLQRRGGPLWPLLEGQRVRREHGVPDAALLLPNSISAALVARATGAPVRAGYALNGRGGLLTHGKVVRREGFLRPVPMVDYYLGLLEHLGADTAGVARCPRLTPSAAARASAEELLTRHGLNARPRLWALNIGGSWDTKQWLPEYAGRLVRLMRARGIAPFLLRGPEEGALAAAVVAAAGEAVPGADDLVGLAELPALLERCELLVTSDSGPRHFGIAAGIPVLVLTGSTHPGYTHVDYADLNLLCDQADCWPCHLKRCPVDFRCMRALTPERVLDAGEAAVERRRVRGRRDSA